MSYKQIGIVTKSWIGLSTDTKPSGTVGDEFYETDTGQTYICNSKELWIIKE
ncbi:MAG: hypothetical protein PHO27_12880 [Sulfuricurvum sp.]|jgi:hypothetical protein|nr:hypothetical protein [Sulfuricurvum sp.]